MKILIVRFSSIGDIVLTSPVIRCLKKQMETELHFITKVQYQEILINNPYLHKIWTIKESVNECIEELKNEGFDCIIDLHKNIRSVTLQRKLKVKNYYTFNKMNIEKWLMVNFKINKLKNNHIVHRYFATTKELGIKYDGNGLDYFYDDKDKIKAKSFLDQYFQNNQYDFIALVIGATYSTKIPPLTFYQEVIKNSASKYILIGGKNDFDRGQILSNTFPNRVFNACGQLTINGSASLINFASKIITPDTGMMHISAALQKEIISIWGNTIPEFGMTPFFPDDLQNKSIIIEVKDISCRPCSKLGFNKCPKKHFDCMKLIDVDSVLNHIKND